MPLNSSSISSQSVFFLLFDHRRSPEDDDDDDDDDDDAPDAPAASIITPRSHLLCLLCVVAGRIVFLGDEEEAAPPQQYPHRRVVGFPLSLVIVDFAWPRTPVATHTAARAKPPPPPQATADDAISFDLFFSERILFYSFFANCCFRLGSNSNTATQKTDSNATQPSATATATATANTPVLYGYYTVLTVHCNILVVYRKYKYCRTSIKSRLLVLYTVPYIINVLIYLYSSKNLRPRSPAKK